MNEQSSFQRFLKDDLFRWKIFAVHFVLFCVSVLLGGWGIVGTTVSAGSPTSPPTIVSSTTQPFPYTISLIWFCFVTLHFCFTLLNESGRAKKRQLAEKPKRHYLELGDDGELVEIAEDEAEEQRKNRL